MQTYRPTSGSSPFSNAGPTSGSSPFSNAGPTSGSGMNILDLFASAGAINAVMELSKYAKADTYVNSDKFVSKLSEGMGLKLAAANLSDLTDKCTDMGFTTPEQYLLSRTDDLIKFQAHYNNYIAGKTGDFATTADTILRIAGILTVIAIQVQQENEWQPVFVELVNQFKGRFEASSLSAAEKTDLMRCCSVALQVAFVAGKKHVWLKMFRSLYPLITTPPEVAQVWLETDGSVSLGLLLSPRPEDLNIEGLDINSGPVANVIANIHRFFPEPEIINGNRYLALQHKNPALFQVAMKENVYIFNVAQFQLYNINTSISEGYQSLSNKIIEMVTNNEDNVVAALTRMGVFPKDMVFKLLTDALKNNFCNLYTALDETNNTEWKDNQKYDLTPYTELYKNCLKGDDLKALEMKHSMEIDELNARLAAEYEAGLNAYNNATDETKLQKENEMHELIARQKQELEDVQARHTAERNAITA